MATGFQEGSATIYQFPLGGRRGLTATRHQETKVSTEAAATRPAEDGGWRQLVP